ncbi:TdeIII family type II restriction endonuclease [Vibrio parahaemolyticus]|uniref:TdeIII family type II restriction endonuclease n=1 Tax=Vibrio parahaemolyticus TaxID=670 RepID=UPI003B673E27
MIIIVAVSYGLIGICMSSDVLIAQEFQSCVDRTIERLRGEDTYRPFHAALLSEEALFWSRFERSFSTSFGQRVIEKISKVCALSGGATGAMTQRSTEFDICSNKLNFIEEHLTSLRDQTFTRGLWERDLRNMQAVLPSGETVRTRVISDLWWVVDGVNHYMSIKTVKPNIDQTAEAKKDLLKLKAYDPNCKVFFGLYYNPFGEDRTSYTWAPPQRIFNFSQDECVLIGKEYWDMLGGIGTYERVLGIARNVGETTRRQISGLR